MGCIIEQQQRQIRAEPDRRRDHHGEQSRAAAFVRQRSRQRRRLCTQPFVFVSTMFARQCLLIMMLVRQQTRTSGIDRCASQPC